jgi:hypothetical protein
MKEKPIHEPTAELKAKCDADNQFSNLDRMFRRVIAAPKDVVKPKTVRTGKKKRSG